MCAVGLGLAVAVALPLAAAPTAAAYPAYPATAGWEGVGAAAVPSADRMPSVDTTFDVDPDGGVSVGETISYTFDPAAGVRHGIYRSITVRQGITADPESYRYLDLTDVTAASPTGANADVQLVDDGAAMTIKVGSANATVSGTQTYVLHYHLAHVVNPFPDTSTAEFYYNVYKSDAVAKDAVTVSVTGPAPATEIRCTRGPGADCDSATAGATAKATVANLVSYEDLTIDTRYPLSAFHTLTSDIRKGGAKVDATQAKALTYSMLGLGVLAPLVAAVGMWSLVARSGRDEWYAGLAPGMTPAPGSSAPTQRRRELPEIAVAFTPPPGVQPGLVGTIVDESADTVDVSATVIDLAARGFLRIEQTAGGGVFGRTDWNLTALTPPPGVALRPYEQIVLSGLFAQSNPVALSQLKNQFAPTLAKAKDNMYDEVLSRGWFRRSPRTQRGLWQTLGALLAGGGAVAAFVFGVKPGPNDLTAGLGLPVSSTFVLGIGVLIAGVIVHQVGGRSPAKTAAGSAVLAQSLGFRTYLETAEANQIRWEEAQEVFSRYLPYAIVFGVARRWAATFQQVAEAAAAAGQPILMPTWYIYSGGLFPDFGSLVDGVDSFSSTAAGTFAATPGSSGGSGFGSSGGMFSGGGVGGSSSGSW
jgi:uncharacterized membrane protein YgcG